MHEILRHQESTIVVYITLLQANKSIQNRFFYLNINNKLYLKLKILICEIYVFELYFVNIFMLSIYNNKKEHLAIKKGSLQHSKKEKYKKVQLFFLIF